MLEKQKIWCKEKLEKGKTWFNKNKVAIGFGAGMAAMAGLHMLDKYLDTPIAGKIVFSKDLEDNEPNLDARVYYLNRLGKERNFITIRHRDDGSSIKAIKTLCDNLNEIVYPGD